jgi:hypothetical protein
MIDLRSDTRSRTADMRTAMANAEVGDVGMKCATPSRNKLHQPCASWVSQAADPIDQGRDERILLRPPHGVRCEHQNRDRHHRLTEHLQVLPKVKLVPVPERGDSRTPQASRQPGAALVSPKESARRSVGRKCIVRGWRLSGGTRGLVPS